MLESPRKVDWRSLKIVGFRDRVVSWGRVGGTTWAWEPVIENTINVFDGRSCHTDPGEAARSREPRTGFGPNERPEVGAPFVSRVLFGCESAFVCNPRLSGRRRGSRADELTGRHGRFGRTAAVVSEGETASVSVPARAGLFDKLRIRNPEQSRETTRCAAPEPCHDPLHRTRESSHSTTLVIGRAHSSSAIWCRAPARKHLFYTACAAVREPD